MPEIKDTVMDDMLPEDQAKLIKQAKQRNKKGLINLTEEEKKRIGLYIQALYQDAKEYHDLACKKIDLYDDVYRMKPMTISGADEDTPNYRSPLSTVMVETIHASVMNVFFTPPNIMRVIPTEKNDIPKIERLDTFGNWSMSNELNIFAGFDRLNHASTKNGTCPYMVDWVKEFGTITKKVQVSDPANPDAEPVYVDKEEEKLVYDGPRLTVFSRKDYILPKSAKADSLPQWEMVRIALTTNDILTREDDNRFYPGTYDAVKGVVSISEVISQDNPSKDQDGNDVPLEKTALEYVKFFGGLRIEAVRKGKDNEIEALDELEDEFIATVELSTGTLCELRVNNLPYKMRPTGLDGFLPDDEGRIDEIGVVEFMSGLQTSYDLLSNQYLFGTVQSNNPFGFFAPTANMKNEPIKAKAGYLYPSADPSKINIVKIPPPDDSLLNMMEQIRNFAQLLFSISDYSMGMESQIDPTAPAKKAEIVVAQGNVRMGLIIKRKNRTLRDIFKKWFLLYQANMPKGKYMRIAGVGKDKWDFEAMGMDDFALSGIPDFELTGNILTSNKQLQVQKSIATYNMLVKNFLFNPQTRDGLAAYYSLTKWLINDLDVIGVADFLPKAMNPSSHTPEEENAMLVQGDEVEPEENDDHIRHTRIVDELINDTRITPEIKDRAINHRIKHANMLKDLLTKQIIAERSGQAGQTMSPPQGLPGAMPQGGQTGMLPQGNMPPQIPQNMGAR